MTHREQTRATTAGVSRRSSASDRRGGRGVASGALTAASARGRRIRPRRAPDRASARAAARRAAAALPASRGGRPAAAAAATACVMSGSSSGIGGPNSGSSARRRRRRRDALAAASRRRRTRDRDPADVGHGDRPAAPSLAASIERQIVERLQRPVVAANREIGLGSRRRQREVVAAVAAAVDALRTRGSRTWDTSWIAPLASLAVGAVADGTGVSASS